MRFVSSSFSMGFFSSQRIFFWQDAPLTSTSTLVEHPISALLVEQPSTSSASPSPGLRESKRSSRSSTVVPNPTVAAQPDRWTAPLMVEAKGTHMQRFPNVSGLIPGRNRSVRGFCTPTRRPKKIQQQTEIRKTTVYIGTRPFVLRDAMYPRQNLQMADSAEILEAVEQRLKEDILREAERWVTTPRRILCSLSSLTFCAVVLAVCC